MKFCIVNVLFVFKLDLKSNKSIKEKTIQLNQQLVKLRKDVIQEKLEKKSEVSKKSQTKKVTQTKKPPTKMETEATTSLVEDLQI